MNNRDYHYIANKLREFFVSKGFVEVECQSAQSILSACENPKSVVTYQMDGVVWPLKQTNQMELEKLLLTDSSLDKIFCFTTSYRDEFRNEMEDGRHLKIFPMCEFESKGNFSDLKRLEHELILHLGFKDTLMELYYDSAVAKYASKIIDSEIEEKIGKDNSNITILSRFPRYTDPFWNMAQFEDDPNSFKKADVLLYGMETIGSAERSCDSDQMSDNFYSICNGEYANILFHKFGKSRVLDELIEFLDLPMTERFGGGIGISRLERAMKLEGIIKE